MRRKLHAALCRAPSEPAILMQSFHLHAEGTASRIWRRPLEMKGPPGALPSLRDRPAGYTDFFMLALFASCFALSCTFSFTCAFGSAGVPPARTNGMGKEGKGCQPPWPFRPPLGSTATPGR